MSSVADGADVPKTVPTGTVGETKTLTAVFELSAPCHPADTDQNWVLDINEIVAYGTAWKTGAIWPTPPNPILIDYLTNAALIWKIGEVYHYDLSQSAPQCWQPGAAVP